MEVDEADAMSFSPRLRPAMIESNSLDTTDSNKDVPDLQVSSDNFNNTASSQPILVGSTTEPNVEDIIRSTTPPGDSPNNFISIPESLRLPVHKRSATQYGIFGRLPPEVRNQIWRFSLLTAFNRYDSGPRFHPPEVECEELDPETSQKNTEPPQAQVMTEAPGQSQGSATGSSAAQESIVQGSTTVLFEAGKAAIDSAPAQTMTPVTTRSRAGVEFPPVLEMGAWPDAPYDEDYPEDAPYIWDDNRYSLALSLLRVNKTIHTETSYIFYQENLFVRVTLPQYSEGPGKLFAGVHALLDKTRSAMGYFLQSDHVIPSKLHAMDIELRWAATLAVVRLHSLMISYDSFGPTHKIMFNIHTQHASNLQSLCSKLLAPFQGLHGFEQAVIVSSEQGCNIHQWTSASSVDLTKNDLNLDGWISRIVRDFTRAHTLGSTGRAVLDVCNEASDNVSYLSCREDRLKVLSKEQIEEVACLVFNTRLSALISEVQLLQYGVYLGNDEWEQIREAVDFLFDMSEAQLPLIAYSPTWDGMNMIWYTEDMRVSIHRLRSKMCLIEGEVYEACEILHKALIHWPANEVLQESFILAKKSYKKFARRDWEPEGDGEQE